MKTKTETKDKKIERHPALAAVAIAGLAAGYYFYASKDAGKHRKIATKWARELKSDVLKQTKKVKNVDKKTLSAIVDSAAKAYSGARGLDKKQIAQAAKELKANWDKVVSEVRGEASKVKKAVAPRAAKKRTAAKKSS
ncbi:MAG: hypothetical protein P4L81_08365 [Candidatus Pacebacteria bacterium]|nr:hypothetical protein [Candidatus Paceibacterota bacterium]